MEVKIKKLHKDAVIPKYAHNGDAGMDLVAVSKEIDSDANIVYDTGLAFEIPKGYVGLVFPRSSNAKKDLLLSNSVGVIDSNYRGSVTLKFKANKPIETTTILKDKDKWKWAKVYEVGDRVGQIIIMPYPQIEFVEVEELSKTERGEGGYGSTGK